MLFEHHCGCTQEVQTNIIPVDHGCCEHDHIMNNCCSQDATGSSCENNPDKKCCKSNTLFIKVDIPVDLPGKSNHARKVLKAEAIVQYFVASTEKASESGNLNIVNPPSPTGHNLKRYIVLHQLKIAPPEYA